jgi:uncharacterized membrane protein YfcA
VGGWIGATIANQLCGPYLQLGFGMFVAGLGIYLALGALQRLS